jgi:hypothetical protein
MLCYRGKGWKGRFQRAEFLEHPVAFGSLGVRGRLKLKAPAEQRWTEGLRSFRRSGKPTRISPTARM